MGNKTWIKILLVSFNFKKYHKSMIHVLFKVYDEKAHNISKASSINQKQFCYGLKTQKKF